MRMIVCFEKTARVRHLGHLDLMRFMQRALRRSGLPIRYSQGFNPHVVMSFASPLSVGFSGEAELYDVALDEPVAEDVFLEKLREAMPDSLPIRGVRTVDDKHPALMAQLCTASYIMDMPVTEESRKIAEAIPSFLARPEIMAMRRTKSGEKLCDIRPMMHELSANETENVVRLTFRTSLMERETLKPDLLLRALSEHAGVEPLQCRVHRTGLYGERDRLPVPLMEI